MTPRQCGLPARYVSRAVALAVLCAETSMCRIKTRIQAASSEDEEKSDGPRKDLSVSALLVSILKEEGIAGYYRGFAATMLNTFSMRAPPLIHIPCSAHANSQYHFP